MTDTNRGRDLPKAKGGRLFADADVAGDGPKRARRMRAIRKKFAEFERVGRDNTLFDMSTKIVDPKHGKREVAKTEKLIADAEAFGMKVPKSVYQYLERLTGFKTSL